jgi:hypothetical protein
MSIIYIAQECRNDNSNSSDKILGIFNSIESCFEIIVNSIFEFKFMVEDLNPKKRFRKEHNYYSKTGYCDTWCRTLTTRVYLISEWILDANNFGIEKSTQFVNFDKMCKEFIVDNKCKKNEIKEYLKSIKKNPKICQCCLSVKREDFWTKDFRRTGESQEIIDEWFQIYGIDDSKKTL